MPPRPPDGRPGPEEEGEAADAVGIALLVVLDTLTPGERLAFVLHDLFPLPFDEIAAILERSPASARQLASRARRRVRGTAPVAPDASRRRRAVEAFLAATRAGDFASLVALLHPDVVLGGHTVAKGAMVATGRDRFTGLALLDGAIGLVMAPGAPSPGPRVHRRPGGRPDHRRRRDRRTRTARGPGADGRLSAARVRTSDRRVCACLGSGRDHIAPPIAPPCGSAEGEHP
ncbi:sigma factor-like helix-turn-helix DNA-binding protein [Streptomyces sp. NPDC102406]|uniref:sigma factor-like helix-turn-helix DNA-binding protein n=1 Tax=Streptomyces sp. NPDC102406 TaxID=3366171 RepID=UPI00382E28C1